MNTAANSDFDKDNDHMGIVLPDRVTGGLTRYAATFTRHGAVFELSFEAVSESDAMAFCRERELGFKGPTVDGSAPRKAMGGVFTVQEVMQQAQLSRTTVYRLLRSGKIRQLRGIRAVRITRRSLEEYFESASCRMRTPRVVSHK